MWFPRLIHMEIIQERIEREFNLDIITMAPSVIYKVMKTNGELIELTNPTNLPEATEIEYMEEPVVTASIIAPSDCWTVWNYVKKEEESLLTCTLRRN